MLVVSMLVGRQSVDTPDRDDVIDPARFQSVVGPVPHADEGVAEAAVLAAHESLPAWSGMSVASRATSLRNAAKALDAMVPELTDLLVRENGKVVVDADRDVRRGVESLE